MDEVTKRLNEKYVLITPARNEEEFIESTIKSVVSQTILPEKWIIVSDGSTDSTNELVEMYSKEHSWIELLCLERTGRRDFSGKARAFNIGYAAMRGVAHEYVGNLDADIIVSEDHYEVLIRRFREHPDLGVAGFPFREGNRSYNYKFSRREHVSGACQLFRRECLEAIGGYRELRGGGIDVAAVLMARQKGWKTFTFLDRVCEHQRPMGSAKGKSVLQYFMSGYYDYCLGVHPVWQLFRCAYMTVRKPILISAMLHEAGFLWALIRRAPYQIEAELVRFRRREQLQWLSEGIRKVLKLYRDCHDNRFIRV